MCTIATVVMSPLVILLVVSMVNMSNSFTLQMGFRSSVAGVLGKLPPVRKVGELLAARRARKQRNDQELKTGIANFYDESSAIWIDVWGENMVCIEMRKSISLHHLLIE
jgi:hypothetical protein